MFKLVRMIHKSSNAPEIEFFKSTCDVEVKRGDIGIVVDGMLTSPDAIAFPYDDICALYVSHGNATTEDETTPIPCSRVTSDMLFDVFCSSCLNPGDKITIYCSNSTRLFTEIKKCGENDVCFGEVYSNKNFTSKHTIQVRFHNVPERIIE